MTNSLDSRFLQYGDTFTQKFTKPGKVRYSVGVGGGPLPGIGFLTPRFTIEVESGAPGRKGKQHRVKVSRGKREFSVEPKELEIKAGDAVTWYASSSQTPPFSVSGRLEGYKFDSASMTEFASYSHPFGTAGEYEWLDANGSGLRGRIVVRQPDLGASDAVERYQKLLTSGILVIVRGGRAEPESVEITVGQTVFWAIEKARGISITDRRLRPDVPPPANPGVTGGAAKTAPPSRARGKR